MFKDYIDHFNAEHVIDCDERNGQEDREVFKADFTMKEAEVGYARRFTKFGRNFFDVGFLDKGILRRWVLLQGSSLEAKKFLYESCLTSPDGSSKLTITDQVISLEENFIDERSKFKLLADFLEAFAQDCGALDYKIKIRNLKEEAKDDDDESGVSDVESSDN